MTNSFHSTEAISVMPKSGWELKGQTSALPKDQWDKLLNDKTLNWLYTPPKENKRSNGRVLRRNKCMFVPAFLVPSLNTAYEKIHVRDNKENTSSKKLCSSDKLYSYSLQTLNSVGN